MNIQKKKIILRERRHRRIRAKIKGTGELPRVALFRSNSHIYSQVIDDRGMITLVSQSDINLTEKDLKKPKDEKDVNKKQLKAFTVGILLAEKMKEKKILQAVLDRGGYRYHGRIKAFTDGLRDGGIKI